MGKELRGTAGKEKTDAGTGIWLEGIGINGINGGNGGNGSSSNSSRDVGSRSINRIDGSKTDPRRKLLLLLGLTAILALLAARLFWIQVLRPHRFSSYEVDLVKNSVLQRQKSIVLDTGRGDMYDRNLKPLTGKTIRTAIIFPVHPDYTGSAEQLRKVSGAFGVTADDWKVFVKQVKEPLLWTGSLTIPDGERTSANGLLPNPASL